MSWRDRARHAVEKNRATPSPTKPTKPTFVSSVSSPPPPIPKEKRAPGASSADKSGDLHGWGYTPADLDEMDRLLRELAELESWTPTELKEMLDQRRRMAPARVPELLKTLRQAQEKQLAPWPTPPNKRAEFRLTTLTVIEGGRSQSDRPGSSKTPDSGKEAA